MISDEQLKAWRALVDALPEGKWEHRRESHQGIMTNDVVEIWHGVWFDDIKRKFFWPPYDTKRGRVLPAEAMAKFIAASRVAVPVLLATVEAQAAELARLRAAGRVLRKMSMAWDMNGDSYCTVCGESMDDTETGEHAEVCDTLVFAEGTE